MTVRDLLEVLNTDSIIIANTNGEIEVDAETPYVEMACNEYLDREIEKVVPLNNKIEVTIKGLA